MAIPDFDYGFLIGAYSFTFAPLLLFAGHFSDNYNRKVLIGVNCVGWGATAFVMSFANNNLYLLICRVFLGIFQAFTGPAMFSIISDFFPSELKVRAFFVYSTLQQLGDTVVFFTINIISLIGWRNSFRLIGLTGLVGGFACLLFVREPKRETDEEVLLESDDEFENDIQKMKTVSGDDQSQSLIHMESKLDS